MMSVIEKVLIGLSVCNCILSVIAVHLVKQGLKRRKEKTAYETAIAEAHEKSYIEVSLTDILQTVEKLQLVESIGNQQTAQVKGTLKSPDVKVDIA